MPDFYSGGVRLAYVDLPALNDGQGDGAPVVLVHGFASNHLINWVNTSWTGTLGRAGYRVVTLDHRGHGASEALYDPAAYSPAIMAQDVARLMDHLEIERADVIGYSMGARITAQLALAQGWRVRSAILGGLGYRLVEGTLLSSGIAQAMDAPSLASLDDPMLRMFRQFAEQTGSDLKALAACVRGSHLPMSPEDCGRLAMPVLIAVGTADPLAVGADRLAALMPNARVLEIPGRDHNLAVGDRVHKAGVLAFLAERGLSQHAPAAKDHPR